MPPKRKTATAAHRKVKRGEIVILKSLPPRFLEDLPEEDQIAISAVVGKPVRFNEYDEDGRAELEFKDANGAFHFIYVQPGFIKMAD